MPHRAPPLILILLLLAISLPDAAAAQVPTPPRDTVIQQIEPQTVRGERGGVVVGGASSLVVTLDSSRSAVSPTLADILRTVPAVVVRTNSRGEVELSVRGSESRQVGIMMNGLPLSAGWDGRADPSLVPLTAISRVAYVRSTASVLGGPNSLGGVIELSFEDPSPGMLHPHLALGSDHTGARLASATVASRRDGGASRLTWRVGGGMRQSDGLVRASDVPDPNGAPSLRTNTDSRQFDFLGSIGWQSARGASAEALVSGYRSTRGVAPELHLASPRYWRYPEQSRGIVQLRAASPRLRSRLGTTEVEVGGGVLTGTTHIETFADAEYSPVANTEDGAEQVNSARFAVTHLLPRGAQLQAALTGNNVMYYETLGTSPTSYYRQDLLSAGLEGRFLVGTATVVSAGAVLDRGATLFAGGRPTLGAKGLAGWRVGATRQVSGDLRLHASASSRGRFPALRELYSGSLNRFEPNPDLEPERLLATEAGVTFGRAEDPTGWNVQLTAFQHHLEDGIVRIPYLATGRFIRVNRDETRSVGLEALLGWSGGPTSPAISIDVVAQRVRIGEQGVGGADRKPEHMPGLRAMVDGTVPVWRGVTLGANVAHVGSQYCVNPDTGNDIALGAESLVGVTAHRSWSLGTGRTFTWMRVIAGVDNLANAAVYEQCGLPRAGRTLRVGVDLR
jgi:outer membrane cobalamin receptor